ncbi:hypothetical protein HQ585_14765 [candidate division KSB1 bacterium]|nr:hypothetical protein [candidate division KSB1 bacterium]
MKKSNTLFVCILLTMCFTSQLAAQSGMALTLQAGTLGAELGFVKTLNPKLNARLGVSYMTYSYSGDSEGEDPVAYNVDMNLFSVGLLVDYHPFENTFRLTGGLLFNNNIFEASAEAVNTYEYDEGTYTPEDIGVLNGKVKPGLPISPYIGFGIGNPVSSDKKLGFYLDLGILYTGSPAVELEADPDTMIYPTADQDKQVEEDLSGIQIYPVLEIGLSYQL